MKKITIDLESLSWDKSANDIHYRTPCVVPFNNDQIKDFCTTIEERPGLSTYVEINGIKWSKFNVNTHGTFVEHEEDYGRVMQWNSLQTWNTEYPITDEDGNTTWDSSPITHGWESGYDPSPSGEWAVPTAEEFDTLFDTTKVRSEFITYNGVDGFSFTDRETNNHIFIPLAPHSIDDLGNILTNTMSCYYWTATSSSNPANATTCNLSIRVSFLTEYPKNAGLHTRPILRQGRDPR